jgi:acetylornithine deacetylase
VRDLGPGGLGQVSYATEAGLFQAAGIPAVVCGPGSIEQAHGPNEYIELDQLARAERFMDRLLERVTR